MPFLFYSRALGNRHFDCPVMYFTLCSKIKFQKYFKLSSLKFQQISRNERSFKRTNRTERNMSEFNEFEPRLKSAENRLQLSTGLNLETMKQILSGSNSSNSTSWPTISKKGGTRPVLPVWSCKIYSETLNNEYIERIPVSYTHLTLPTKRIV